MGRIIVPNAVVRKPKMLYFINKNGDVCEAPMSHGGRKKKAKK